MILWCCLEHCGVYDVVVSRTWWCLGCYGVQDVVVSNTLWYLGHFGVQDAVDYIMLWCLGRRGVQDVVVSRMLWRLGLCGVYRKLHHSITTILSILYNTIFPDQSVRLLHDTQSIFIIVVKFRCMVDIDHLNQNRYVQQKHIQHYSSLYMYTYILCCRIPVNATHNISIALPLYGLRTIKLYGY